MSVAVTANTVLTAIETVALTGGSDDTISITYDQFNVQETLGASSTPPATKVFGAAIALSGGAKTLDLTALADGQLSTKDFTGLKLQYFLFKNLAANANDMTVTFGAANPYELMGADFKVTVKPGQHLFFRGADTTPDVAGGAKNIDVAGTDAQVFHVEIVAG